MFNLPVIEDKINNSSSLSTQAQIIAEWNLNAFDNIKKIGNYRYRPTVASPTTANFGVIAPTYDESDILKAYTGATDSDIVVDGSYNEQGVPQVFLSQDKQRTMLYSLEQCFYKFRPRSGINKLLFLPDKKTAWSLNDSAGSLYFLKHSCSVSSSCRTLSPVQSL